MERHKLLIKTITIAIASNVDKLKDGVQSSSEVSRLTGELSGYQHGLSAVVEASSVGKYSKVFARMTSILEHWEAYKNRNVEEFETNPGRQGLEDSITHYEASIRTLSDCRRALASEVS